MMRRANRARALRGPVLLDWESRSRCDLRKRGGRNYWEDPSSEALCAVAHVVETGETIDWAPGDPPLHCEIAAAHNMTGFDRFAMAAYGWTAERIVDTAHCAVRSGLPRSLEAAAERLLGRHKDAAGNKLVTSLGRPSRAKATRGELPTVTPEIRQRVIEYCRDDVQVLADAWPQLEPWADMDQDVADCDRTINDRGITLDVDLVRAMQKLQREQQEAEVARVAKALRWSVEDTRRRARSPIEFAEITRLPDARAETLIDRVAYGALLDHPLVAARRALASIVPGKLVAALERVSPDGRLRDSLLYCGAHTWRWSGKGVQTQNLTRAEAHGGGEMINRLADACKAGQVTSALLEAAFPGEGKRSRDALLMATLMRAAFTGSPGGCLSEQDYSLIEPRLTAWAAGDQAALDIFRASDDGTGPDPYCVMASKVFGYAVNKKEHPAQRQLGKAAVIACGYSMGPDKFRARCEQDGIDLDAVGIDAAEVVATWRKVHRKICELWWACDRAFVDAVNGRTGRAGPFTYEPIGDAVACVLPSGRPIMYPEARAKRVKRQGRNGQYDAWDLSYLGHKHGKSRRTKVYGGLFVENAVQGMSRDLLADAMVRCEADGLDPVTHAHDALVCDVLWKYRADAAAHQTHIMATPPAWARGLPVKLDGFAEFRYRK